MRIYNPQSITEALELLHTADKHIKVLAGGTDLIVHYKKGKIKPEQVCNLSQIKELSYILEEEENLRVGPLVTFAQLKDSPLINEYAGALAEAASLVGSPQIRNRGTIGGNIGTASPAGDTLPVLICLNAQLEVENLEGKRVIPLRRFFTGPGQHILAPNELITGIIIPKLKEQEKSGYLKLGMRNALAISVASVAVKAQKSKNILSGVEAAFGSVGPVVLYFPLPVFDGICPTEKDLWDRVQFIKDKVNPITDIRATREYRQEMAASLLYQALIKL